MKHPKLKGETVGDWLVRLAEDGVIDPVRNPSICAKMYDKEKANAAAVNILLADNSLTTEQRDLLFKDVGINPDDFNGAPDTKH